jgi:hypothetical protein
MKVIRACFVVFLLIAGCAPSHYTSLDLALLPCEQGAAPIFFSAVEFDEHGRFVYEFQEQELLHHLSSGPRITDLIFFIHGWNKNPSSAETDYQNFLCRLHARLRTVIGDAKREGRLLVVGIFWPSTITNSTHEPFLLKPISYYRIRDRVTDVAQNGLAPLFVRLTPLISQQRGDGNVTRLHLMGHSFGGRMLVRTLEQMSTDGTLVPLLLAAGEVNVVLLNAAIPPERFEWLSQAVTNAKRAGIPARITEETNSYLFNVHSFNDTANRVLFRMASVFNDDPSTCAAGACGVPGYPTLCVDESGKALPPPVIAKDVTIKALGLNAFNVDVSKIVFDHNDVYKGRIASLITDLLYDQQKRTWAHSIAKSDNDPLCP